MWSTKAPEIGKQYNLNEIRRFRCTDSLCDIPAVVTAVEDKVVTYDIGTYTNQHASIKLFNKIYTPI